MKIHRSFALMLVVFISACGDSGSQLSSTAQPKVAVHAYGVVSFDGPVAGATVTVLNLQGLVIGQGSTSPTGHYSVLTPDALTDFTVAAAGGISAGRPMQGELTAEVRNRPYYGGNTPVNVPTTLASKLMRRDPSYSLTAAVASVKRFLQIPENYNLGHQLTGFQFNEAAFAKAAMQAGGEDKFFSQLIGEFEAGGNRQFSQISTPLVKNSMQAAGTQQSIQNSPRLLANVAEEPQDQLLQLIAKNIAGSVLSAAGKKLANQDFVISIMASVGLGGSGSTDPSIATALAEQKLILQQISQQVAALATQLTAVEATIIREVDKKAYDISELTIAPLLAANLHVESDLIYLAGNPGDTATRDNLDSVIVDLLNGAMEKWHIAIVGTGNGDNGLLVSWNRLMGTLNSDLYTGDMASAIQSKWDYLDYSQSQTMALLIDYQRGHPETYSYPKMLYDVQAWKNRREQQLALVRGNTRLSDKFYYAGSDGSNDLMMFKETRYRSPLPDKTLIDRQTSLMWTLEGYTVSREQWVDDSTTDLSTSIRNYHRILGETVADLQRTSGISSWVQPLKKDIPPSTSQFFPLRTLRLWGLKTFPIPIYWADVLPLGFLVTKYRGAANPPGLREACDLLVTEQVFMPMLMFEAQESPTNLAYTVWPTYEVSPSRTDVFCQIYRPAYSGNPESVVYGYSDRNYGTNTFGNLNGEYGSYAGPYGGASGTRFRLIFVNQDAKTNPYWH